MESFRIRKALLGNHKNFIHTILQTAGFTFIRNALLYDYPVVEAITSILPLCDHIVVAVGRSDDETLDLVRGIPSAKLQIIETEWDDTQRTGGRVLALETDKAFQAISKEYDWCFYIQADECVHEQDHAHIRAAMEQYLADGATEGLLFKYRHFYGSYNYIGVSRKWYRREVRIVRNNKDIRSYRDAQGFRHADGSKLKVRLLDAWIHHYGWVKHPAAQQRKQRNFNRLWHDDRWVDEHVPDIAGYDYEGTEPLARFEGTHPAVMLPRIASVNWSFKGDPGGNRWGWKDRLSRWVENATGWRPGEYRNYKLIR